MELIINEKREILSPIESEIRKRQLKLNEKCPVSIDGLTKYAKNLAKTLSFSKRENLSVDVDDINLTLFSAEDKIWLAIKKEDEMLMFTSWDKEEING